ncbi:L-rhamnose mutarotase [Paraglaciecola sp. L3A3]|uniref:L-rhamnose mutarotase n=1 Tax=Paraglaciecola sp. L3A3 TaxID=2686358 RepID=UPI00131B473E|nr:L-rhamnose mutarotase [Paraglaciecola sp. L3A3]
MSKTHCLTLNLRDDAELIQEYEDYHKPGKVWPEVIDSIKNSEIISMKIFRQDLLLIMVIEVTESFSFEKKAKADFNNEKIQAWERLMEKFQKVDPNEPNAGKWQAVTNIFCLEEH